MILSPNILETPENDHYNDYKQWNLLHLILNQSKIICDQNHARFEVWRKVVTFERMIF